MPPAPFLDDVIRLRWTIRRNVAAAESQRSGGFGDRQSQLLFAQPAHDIGFPQAKNEIQHDLIETRR